MNRQSPYDLGQQAAEQGKPLDNNPFPGGGSEDNINQSRYAYFVGYLDKKCGDLAENVRQRVLGIAA